MNDPIAEEIGRLLLSYSGPEPDRVRSAIACLADDDPKRVAHLVERATQDYRDVLYWLELKEGEDRERQLLSGMTVNERLSHLKLMGKWDAAIADQDEGAVVEILRRCDLSTDSKYVKQLMARR